MARREPSFRSSNPTVDLSVHDSDVDVLEDDDQPRVHRPSRLRSFTVKLIVVLTFTALWLLVATELSIVLKVPWLDPRPLLVDAYRAVEAAVRSRL